MLNCNICGKETRQLVIPEGVKLSGRCCAGMSTKRQNVNLGQTVESWTHIDKQGVEHKHKLTVGKDWEVQNRGFADDGKTVINTKTGKPAQY